MIFAVALTIADNSYMGLDSISSLDFQIPWEHTTSPMSFLTLGKRNFPSSSASGNVKSGGRHHKISFEHHGDYRLLTFHMDKFFDGKPTDGEIRLENPPQESMVIVTPFAEKDRFLFESKDQLHACRRRGTFLDGKTYRFEPGASLRCWTGDAGVWTYKNTWYWAQRLPVWWTAFRLAGTSATVSATPPRRPKTCFFITARRISRIAYNSTSR